MIINPEELLNIYAAGKKPLDVFISWTILSGSRNQTTGYEIIEKIDKHFLRDNAIL
jgi:hypothetical protein